MNKNKFVAILQFSVWKTATDEKTLKISFRKLWEFMIPPNFPKTKFSTNKLNLNLKN